MRTSLSRTSDSASQYGRLMRACCESLETRRLFAVVTEGTQFGLVDGANNTVLQLTDGDGDIVQYSLNGGATGTITDGSLQLTNTTQRSTLRITVRKAAGGDGLVTVSGITADGSMKSIDGVSVIENGAILLNSPGDVAVTPVGTVAIRLNRIVDGSINTGGEPISSLTLQNWGTASSDAVTQEVRAPWIGTLSVKGGAVKSSGETLAGDMASALILDGNANNGQSLRTATVLGTIGNITATGTIGNLTAGAINGAISAASIGTVTTRVGKGTNASDGSATGSIVATGTPAQRGRAAIGTVRIGGDATDLTIRTDTGNLGDVTISGNATNVQILSAGTARNLRVGGAFSNSRIQTQGNVSNVTLGSMADSNVLVGVAPDFTDAFPATDAGFANGASTVARLSNFTVGKSQAAAAAAQVTGTNNLTAAQLGNVRVFNMENVDTPSLHIYVLDASGKSPNSVRYTDNANPANSFNWKRGQTQPALLQAMLTIVPAAV